MNNLREIIQSSFTLVHKVIAMQKNVSRRLETKSTITEWIKKILEVVFEFMSS